MADDHNRHFLSQTCFSMNSRDRLQILDGPIGTELLVRGVDTPLPGWSAHALESAPDIVRAIHHDYAAAGATVHTANTFRTQPRVFPEIWQELTRRAVDLAREGTDGFEVQLAGSISPIEDCYRPDRSPLHPRPGHRAMARELAAAGVDLLLVETFPHPDEAIVATEEALATGLPVWLSLTAGPEADLLSPEAMHTASRRAAALGVTALLVNCIPTPRVSEFLGALRGHGVPFGAYANAGEVDPDVGFKVGAIAPDEYQAYADEWRQLGATILGGCCGTGLEHIRALSNTAP